MDKCTYIWRIVKPRSPGQFRIFSAVLAVVTVYSYPFAGQTTCAEESSSIAIARGSVKIDGILDPIWNEVEPLTVNQRVPTPDAAAPNSIASAEVRLLWDDDYLYALWEVHDSQVQARHADPWQQDSVELFLDENHARSASYEADDGQWRVNVRGEVSGGGPAFQPDALQQSVQIRPNGYTIEMSIRWQTMRSPAVDAIGLELQVNDDAGQGWRESIVKWHEATDAAWRDPSTFGTAILNDIPPGAVAAKNKSFSATSNDSHQPPDSPSTTAKMPIVHDSTAARSVPDWVADAIFYQVFPERFRNGDSRNDPTWESLEDPSRVPRTWRVTPWTADWYARDDWEREVGPNFYEDGVFDRRCGGDLQGIIDKLDYLRDLGINAIYLNPVFYARSLHKYDGSSMHHIDPYFGPDPTGDLAMMAKETSDPQTWNWTSADRLFLKLIKEAHDRGIRVIIDGVFNHTGRGFFAFADLLRNQQASPYTDWYVVKSFDDPNTPHNEFAAQYWWGVETLPEFADRADGKNLAEGPRQYLHAITRRWMDPNGDGDPGDGIDGWRLDVANEVPDGFWREWHQQVQTLNPHAYTAAEIWTDSAAYLDRCEFSGSMNYHALAYPVKGFFMDRSMSATAFASMIDHRRREMPPRRQQAMLNLLDSHDTDRLASMIVNAGRHPYLQVDRFDYDVQGRVSPRSFPEYHVAAPNEHHRQIQLLCAFFAMTYTGAPMVYYGTEAGMWGADDPDDRMPMVWDDLQYDDQRAHPLAGHVRPADRVAYHHPLADAYRRMIHLRRDSPALRRGTVQLAAAEDDRRLLAMVRQSKTQSAVILFNCDEEPASWTFRASLSDHCLQRPAQVVTSSLDGSTADCRIEYLDGIVKAQIPALTAFAVAWPHTIEVAPHPTSSPDQP